MKICYYYINQNVKIMILLLLEHSNETHLHWKKHFHKNPIYFRIYGYFEADNEKDNSIVGNKTTNIYKKV